MEGICKSFPGVRALDNAQICVKAGTVHALMGENGAGKSTLMKCLFGVYEKDSGRIVIEGKEVSFKSSREALDGGVAMVHQELNQALKLSVGDNLWLGRFPRISPLLPLTSEKKIREKTEALFEELGTAGLHTFVHHVQEICTRFSFNCNMYETIFKEMDEERLHSVCLIRKDDTPTTRKCSKEDIFEAFDFYTNR